MKQRTAEARKAAAKNGSTAATQQKVRQAPNTAPKHANPKTWRQRTAAKVNGQNVAQRRARHRYFWASVRSAPLAMCEACAYSWRNPVASVNALGT